MSSAEKLARQVKERCPTTVFMGVNLLPMDSERIVEEQIVVVEGDRITAIGGPDEVTVPETSLVVVGFDRYLMPGLADMHVHITSERDLLLFIAHGVTTVQNMWGYTGLLRIFGFPDQRDMRDRICRGDLIGPSIYTAGPILDGRPKNRPWMRGVASPKSAVRNVAQQTAGGYDFIKVYDHLDADVYNSILHTARKQDIPVKGHVPGAVGLDKVLESGQVSIEHLTGYIDPDAADFIIPRDRLKYYAEKTRTSSVWNCPTITVWQKIDPSEQAEQLADHPGMKYVSGMGRFFLRQSLKAMRKNVTYTGTDYTARMRDIGYRMTKALHDEGAGLVLGTDAGNPFVFPGWSIHEELEHMVNAGLTPFQAIRMGTRNAAESINRLDEFGTVAVGKRADFILLEENPLEDVRNIRETFVGVMVRGVYFSEMQIRDMINHIATKK